MDTETTHRGIALLRVAINGVWVDAYLVTGATISLVSSRFVHYEDLGG